MAIKYIQVNFRKPRNDLNEMLRKKYLISSFILVAALSTTSCSQNALPPVVDELKEKYFADVEDTETETSIDENKSAVESQPSDERLESTKEISARELRRQKEALAFFEKESKFSDSAPLYKGYALLWLGKDLDKANMLIEKAYRDMVIGAALEKEIKDDSKLTPEIAGAEKVKWQFRTWVKLYYMFSEKGDEFRGRLSNDNVKRIEDLCWNYLLYDKNQL